MNEDCLGCEWYNKPYWSIISPCTNCSKRFKEKPIKVTKYSINIDKSDLYTKIEQLQQENEQLKEINEEHKKLNGELREENKKYKEVIKKVKKMIIDNIEETTYEYIGSNKIKVLLELRMDNDGVNKLLDILKDVE